MLSLRLTYPTSETGLEFHALYPSFVRTALTEAGPMKADMLIPAMKRQLFPNVEEYVESALKVKILRSNSSAILSVSANQRIAFDQIHWLAENDSTAQIGHSFLENLYIDKHADRLELPTKYY